MLMKSYNNSYMYKDCNSGGRRYANHDRPRRRRAPPPPTSSHGRQQQLLQTYTDPHHARQHGGGEEGERQHPPIDALQLLFDNLDSPSLLSPLNGGSGGDSATSSGAIVRTTNGASSMKPRMDQIKENQQHLGPLDQAKQINQRYSSRNHRRLYDSRQEPPKPPGTKATDSRHRGNPSTTRSTGPSIPHSKSRLLLRRRKLRVTKLKRVTKSSPMKAMAGPGRTHHHDSVEAVMPAVVSWTIRPMPTMAYVDDNKILCKSSILSQPPPQESSSGLPSYDTTARYEQLCCTGKQGGREQQHYHHQRSMSPKSDRSTEIYKYVATGPQERSIGSISVSHGATTSTRIKIQITITQGSSTTTTDGTTAENAISLCYDDSDDAETNTENNKSITNQTTTKSKSQQQHRSLASAKNKMMKKHTITGTTNQVPASETPFTTTAANAMAAVAAGVADQPTISRTDPVATHLKANKEDLMKDGMHFVGRSSLLSGLNRNMHPQHKYQQDRAALNTHTKSIQDKSHSIASSKSVTFGSTPTIPSQFSTVVPKQLSGSTILQTSEQDERCGDIDDHDGYGDVEIVGHVPPPAATTTTTQARTIRSNTAMATLPRPSFAFAKHCNNASNGGSLSYDSQLHTNSIQTNKSLPNKGEYEYRCNNSSSSTGDKDNGDDSYNLDEEKVGNTNFGVSDAKMRRGGVAPARKSTMPTKNELTASSAPSGKQTELQQNQQNMATLDRDLVNDLISGVEKSGYHKIVNNIVVTRAFRALPSATFVPLPSCYSSDSSCGEVDDFWPTRPKRKADASLVKQQPSKH